MEKLVQSLQTVVCSPVTRYGTLAVPEESFIHAHVCAESLWATFHYVGGLCALGFTIIFLSPKYPSFLGFLMEFISEASNYLHCSSELCPNSP